MKNTCSRENTRNLSVSLRIVAAANHRHYLYRTAFMRILNAGILLYRRHAADNEDGLGHPSECHGGKGLDNSGEGPIDLYSALVGA
jgi:hypothetical protein